MARRILPLILVLAAAGSWYAWGPRFWQSGSVPVEQRPSPPLPYATIPALGFLAPNFSLDTMDGRAVRLADYLGEPVVVSFWTTRCPFCQSQLRVFERLGNEEEEKGEGIVLLAVNRQEDRPTVASYINTYIAPLAFVTVLIDEEGDIYRSYGAQALPETFFIDTQGVIRGQAREELSLYELRRSIKPLFAR